MDKFYKKMLDDGHSPYLVENLMDNGIMPGVEFKLIDEHILHEYPSITKYLPIAKYYKQYEKGDILLYNYRQEFLYKIPEKEGE